MSTAKEILNTGDLNHWGPVAKAIGLGSIVTMEGGCRQVYEPAVPVAGAAAITKYTVKKLVFAKTSGTGAPAEKATTGIAGSSPGTGAAAPASDGKSVVFNAETTGTGFAELIYYTTDAVLTPDTNQVRVAPAANVPGINV